MKPRKIQISPVHDAESSGFENQSIENIHIVHFPLGNLDKRGNASAQIQKRVKFYSGLVLPKSRLGEKSQTQIDRGGIQGVDGLFQFDFERFAEIESSGRVNQNLSEVRVDTPVSRFVGVGKSAF